MKSFFLDTEEMSEGGLSGGTIAGIVIGSLIGIGLFIFIITHKDSKAKWNRFKERTRTRLQNFRNMFTRSQVRSRRLAPTRSSSTNK